MESLGYLASLLMGVVLGVMGGGGSILTVPIMVYLFGFSPTVATGNSLFVVGLSALVGSVLYIRKGDVDYRVAFAFALPSIVGVNLSRGLITPNLPAVIVSFGNYSLSKEVLIMAVFAALMIAASYSMIRTGPSAPTSKEIKPTSWAIPPSLRFPSIATLGILVGLIAGFVGAGGGFLIIPALVLLAGLSMRVAVGTSLMIIALQSLLGFAGDVSRGADINWTLLLTVVAVASVGVVGGSMIAHKIKEQALKKSFGWFVLMMGLTILIEQFRHMSF